MLNVQHGGLFGALLPPQVARSPCNRCENGGEENYSPISNHGYAFCSAKQSTGGTTPIPVVKLRLGRMFESAVKSIIVRPRKTQGQPPVPSLQLNN